MDFATDIDQRTGWPDELCVLLERYPRNTWRATASPLAEFWIERHDHFRHQSSALGAAADAYREQRAAAPEFGAIVAPRLQAFIAQLHGHHHIEDFHYFPAFRAADPRLAAGFDVLANDHELLHRGIVEIIETANAFLATLSADAATNPDAQRRAADRYIRTAELLHKRLARHLDDEEDLIIPLMLARDE